LAENDDLPEFRKSGAKFFSTFSLRKREEIRKEYQKIFRVVLEKRKLQEEESKFNFSRSSFSFQIPILGNVWIFLLLICELYKLQITSSTGIEKLKKES